jgi:hypothetical protein
MTLRYSLELLAATPSNNVIKGMHFQAYATLRKKWQMLVFIALGGRRPLSAVQASFIVVSRQCPGTGLDWDNALGGLKPLLDCLVMPSKRNPDGLGLIQDDNPKHMPFPPLMRQLPAKKGQERTLVEIFEVTE